MRNNKKTIVVLLVIPLLLVVSYFQLEEKPSADRPVEIVHVPSTLHKAMSKSNPQVSSYTPNRGWIVRPSSSTMPAEKPNLADAKLFNITQEFIVKNTGIDTVWSGLSEKKLHKLVEGMSNIRGKPEIRCGAYMCEVHILTNYNLNESDKNAIVKKLAEPAFDTNKPRLFIVRQIFSNKDVGEPIDGFFAFYQRTVT